ncbi:hypothetical protein SAMN05216553_12637 [Lentzea fradiae]|uniref:MmpS family membrane protein n=1 Tax=Lentzea fradiae TaxID=200378 RepID=A0A1G8D693_9PSEU|nr:hypothetical protein [Lentzea fradiae]SDH53024.1 hypothetical protein SAMN05216553_12637 [Lentzea fradiae]
MKTTLVVLAVLILLAGGTVALVNHYGGWNALTGKAWAVTYEVSSEPAQTAVDVTYTESADRFRKEPSQTHSVSAPAPWTYDAVVNAGEKASVTATPKGDQVLSCRILLDGIKDLARKTGLPGREVRCETVTSS